ncbi:short-chain dehydrogenase [Arachidicoccus ginsenosidimutans]|uniref:SDR family oxidoreductase n=1 Tax=Arachidicoccus sp. BS20 TaxID=1850526 RepID=UPI0007F181EE|nr:SDR family NAD(P)-dependent oxidoreductase [Arachidicoccus sp. BS20]ANI89668.1 short-chain dehydrogenase [Arachidicoccus sp. BS20]
MELSDSTILITGGTSGIGLEFAKQLLLQGAKIIVTARDIAKLNQTKKQFSQINIIQSDINNLKDIEQLYEQVTQQFPGLNIIINNAGIMQNADLQNPHLDLENCTREIETNFAGTVRMIHQFLPHLQTKKSSAIINISSGLAFIPFTVSPIYCGTKAGIHIYSQALRLQLENTNVKVFEIAPPKTDNPMQKAIPETNGKGMMKVDKMVSIAVKGILKDKFEIRPGLANIMKWMSRIAPDFFAKLVDRNIKKRRQKLINSLQ